MVKYLILIGLFLCYSFNAQEILNEKQLKYYGVKDDTEFLFYFLLFAGEASREYTPFRDDFNTKYRLNWGYIHPDLKTISPMKSLYDLTFDLDTKSRIPVDFVHKEVIEHLEGSGGAVMYVTPRLDISGYEERKTGVLLHILDIHNEFMPRCREYFLLPNDKKMNAPSEAWRPRGKDRLYHEVKLNEKLRYCIFKEGLDDKMLIRMDDWGILSKRKWDNWQWWWQQ